MARNKVVTLEQALAKCHDGMTIMLSGFTNVGSPNKFCRALADTGIKDLHIIANDAGNDKADGIGTFIVEGRTSSLVASLYPDVPMDLVRGNCDWGKAPDLRVVELEGVRFLLTHGHLQYVKSGLDELLQEGLNRQVNVICFGHTHLAKVVYRQGIYLMNPGTVGGCRAREGYGVIHAQDGSVNLELK